MIEKCRKLNWKREGKLLGNYWARRFCTGGWEGRRFRDKIKAHVQYE